MCVESGRGGGGGVSDPDGKTKCKEGMIPVLRRKGALGCSHLLNSCSGLWGHTVNTQKEKTDN